MIRSPSTKTVVLLIAGIALCILIYPTARTHLAVNVGYRELSADLVGASSPSAVEACSRSETVADLSAETAWFSSALAYHPQNDAALIGYGLARCLSGEAAEAEEAFDTRPQDGSQQASLVQGVTLMATGNHPDAVAVLSSVPLIHHYATHLTSRYLAEEQYADALFWGELLIATQPTRLGALRLAESYERLGQPGHVAEMWQTIIAHTTSGEDVHWWATGELALLEGNHPDAVAAFQHGADVSHEPYWYWERAGVVQQRMGDWSGALASFEQAIAAFARYQSVYLSAADVAQAQGDVALARDYYERALAAGIDSAEIRTRLENLTE